MLGKVRKMLPRGSKRVRDHADGECCLKIFRCPRCPEIFPKWCRLLDHLRTEHKEEFASKKVNMGDFKPGGKYWANCMAVRPKSKSKRRIEEALPMLSP